MDVSTAAGYGLAAGYLLLCSISDIRTRSVPARLLFSGMAGGAAFRVALLLLGKSPLMELPVLLLPGLGLLILAWISHEIGEGDGIAWIGLGGFLGPDVLMTGMITLFLTFLWGAFLMLRKKAGRKFRIPFLPFSLAGLVIRILFRYLE